MRSLFLKIFLWFWGTVVTTAMAFAALVRILGLGPESTPTRWHLAWGAALLVSGGICYLLTRYLTGPVLRLRAAARRLAEGELTARASDVKPRHDEIGELVRDFNFMAGRVEALVTSQRQLISDISHELRSPLARINATLGLARQRLGQNVLFDRLERDTERLNEMIGRLLTLARLDMTTTVPDMWQTDLKALVSNIVADAQWEARQRDCRVDLVSDGNCKIEANADLLRSAAENVIRNAVRYTASGTAVEVRLECHHGDDGDSAIIRVSDRGPGVPAAELSNIFRPFYRVADARDRQSGGVGLGLAIAERVARVHGGSVRAENRAGGGLEVVLTVKFASAGKSSETGQSSAMPPPSEAHPLPIANRKS
jgi:two-component system, OmpR family, sensor histidine kinase CpxA